MFTKLATHKTFEYTPRIYDPKKDESNKTRIHFRNMRLHRRRSPSFIWILTLLVLVVSLIILLSKMANN
jgi:hypothetical protein